MSVLAGCLMLYFVISTIVLGIVSLGMIGMSIEGQNTPAYIAVPVPLLFGIHLAFAIAIGNIIGGGFMSGSS